MTANSCPSLTKSPFSIRYFAGSICIERPLGSPPRLSPRLSPSALLFASGISIHRHSALSLGFLSSLPFPDDQNASTHAQLHAAFFGIFSRFYFSPACDLLRSST